MDSLHELPHSGYSTFQNELASPNSQFRQAINEGDKGYSFCAAQTKDQVDFEELPTCHELIQENDKKPLLTESSPRLKSERIEMGITEFLTKIPFAAAIFEPTENGKNFILLDLNQNAEKIENVKKVDVLGKRVSHVFPTSKTGGLIELLQDMWKTGISKYFPSVFCLDRNNVGSWRDYWIIQLLGGNILVAYSDVTKNKKAEFELYHLNEKLRISSSITRHDIRNKLAAFNGNLYLLKKKINDPSILKYVTDLERASNQINSIFDFQRSIEQVGSEDFCFIDVDMAFYEGATLASVNGRLKVSCAVSGLKVLADSLLYHVFYILVNNSIIHGVKAKELSLQCRKEPDSIIIIYQDDGIGISDELRTALLLKGFGEGTGFGLFMAKKIVEKYGWKIQENGAEGRGIKIELAVPLEKVKTEP